MSLIEFLITVLPIVGNYSCLEWGNCTLNGQMFQVALYPYQITLGAFTPVAIWGILIAIIWKRSQSMLVVGIVGLAVNSLLITFYAPARQIGWYLLVVAAGITLYQLFTMRSHGQSIN